MATRLRIAGWSLFVAGASVAGFLGDLDLKQTPTWVGMFLALGGMVLTSTSNVINAWALQRQTGKARPDRSSKK